MLEKITPISKMSQINEAVFKDTDGLKAEELALKIASNFEKINPGAKVIYMTETGSVLQGTSINDYNHDTSRTSDFDVKCIYLPSLVTIIGDDNHLMKSFEFNSNKETKNGANDIDISFIPLDEFLKKLSKKMETNAVELLFSMFSNKIIFEDKKFTEMVKNNFSKLLFNETRSLTGFAVTQANKYSVKGDRLVELEKFSQWFSSKVKELNPTKREKKNISINIFPIENYVNNNDFKFIKIVEISHSGALNKYIQILGKEFILKTNLEFFQYNLNQMNKRFGNRVREASKSSGSKSVDYKAFSHAFRALYQAIELIETGRLQFPTPYADEIMRVKFGEIVEKELLTNRLDEIEEKLIRLIDSGRTKLPQRSDETFVKNIKLSMYNLDLI